MQTFCALLFQFNARTSNDWTINRCNLQKEKLSSVTGTTTKNGNIKKAFIFFYCVMFSLYRLEPQQWRWWSFVWWHRMSVVCTLVERMKKSWKHCWRDYIKTDFCIQSIQTRSVEEWNATLSKLHPCYVNSGIITAQRARKHTHMKFFIQKIQIFFYLSGEILQIVYI